MSRIGIEAEAPGDARLHQLHDAAHRLFGIGRGDEVEVGLALGLRQIRHPALIDLVGTGDDPALRRLPEDLGQPHRGHGAGADDIRQHLPGTDGGQLVDITDHQERRHDPGRL